LCVSGMTQGVSQPLPGICHMHPNPVSRDTQTMTPAGRRPRNERPPRLAVMQA
jgi:hypothetical protein